MVYLFFYKLACLLVGLTIVLLGYFLFAKGLYRSGGDVAAQWQNYKLIIRKAAAGTYFVLFGSIIIALTLYKGFTGTEGSTTTNPPSASYNLEGGKKHESLDTVNLQSFKNIK